MGIANIGEEELDGVTYYWAAPDLLPRPDNPWDVIINSNLDRINWSIKSFGIPGTREHPGRWFMWKSRFYFQNDFDRAIFVLKWV